jgi:hypothetical protein
MEMKIRHADCRHGRVPSGVAAEVAAPQNPAQRAGEDERCAIGSDISIQVLLDGLDNGGRDGDCPGSCP